MTTAAVSGMGSDAFMTLFITQLKNQDPTTPMDATTMTTQLAQMTQVQKLDAMSQTFNQALRTEQMTLARGLIGSQLTFEIQGQLANGAAEAVEVVNGVIGVRVGTQFVALDSIIQVEPAPTTPA